MRKVFLGGTCNGSGWRDELIKMLNIDYFNPVVDDWDEEAQQEEIRQRQICDYVLYVITPKMTGVYSIAEAVDDSNKQPEKTVFCFLTEDAGTKFSHDALRSLVRVGVMVTTNGGYWAKSLEEVANYLNKKGR